MPTIILCKRANPVPGRLQVRSMVLTLFIYASGGNGGSAGGACANTSRLQGYVGGTLISVNASNNPAYGKTAFISFAVPAGTSYQITSYPTENTSCGAGVFSVFGYQT